MTRASGERFGDPRRGSDEIEQEVDEEIRHHLERRAAALVDAGMSPTEALAEARRRFGGIEAVRRECLALQGRQERRAVRRDLVGDLARDLRLALRRLRREPGFAVAAIATLGLGLGALLAIFAVFDAVVLRPLPYAEADRLVAVWPELRSRAELAAVEGLASLEEVAAFQEGLRMTLPGLDAPLRVDAAKVTPSLFRVLSQRPVAGRLLGDEDAAEGVRRAMISERLWRRVWGSDPGVVGGAVELDGRSWEVVGVLPARFHFPRAEIEVWIPLDRDAPRSSGYWWGSYDLRLVGKLARGATPERVAAELRPLAARLRLENPVWTPAEEYGRDASAPPLQRQLAGSDLRRLLGVLLAAVAALLVIVCVNVAGLLLARAGARRREAAVRSSLGAGRVRLIFQQLVESLVLAAGGAGLGLAIARTLTGALAAGLDGVDARFGEVGLDARLGAAAAAMVAVTAVGIGVWPALRITSAPGDLLPGRSPGGGSGRSGGRRLLIVAQVALGMVLVSGASLLLLSFWNLSRVDPGFDGREVLAARLDPPAAAYEDPAAVVALYRHVLERLAASPGVEAVAAASALPLDGAQGRMAFPASGLAAEEGRLPVAVRRVVSQGYFRTLGIPLLEGRPFDARDGVDGPPVAMVNRTLAETIWPGRSAVGERIGMPWDRVPGIEVIGVVEDALQDRLDAEVEPEIFLPLAQAASAEMLVLARAGNGDPLALAGAVRGAVAAVDGRIPVTGLRTLRAVTLGSIGRARALAALTAGLAALALGMAAVGVYGVVAFLVEERRGEIGVRMALGATRGRVAGSVLRQGLGLGTAGAALGVIATLASSRALRGFLFETSPLEPAVLVTVPLALLAVCAAASWLPARRAARLDPVEALRAE